MLTSKDVLERTGISRATLNNYISTGLLPRPEVLPPNPADGAAPRIGYFPDDTVDRIAEIQRLKREGWSIARIAAHFVQRGGGASGTTDAPVRTGLAKAAAPAVAPAPPASVDRRLARPTLSLADIPHPAYLLDGSLGLVWANDAALGHAESPLQGLSMEAPAGSVALRLLAWTERKGAEGVLQFHVGLAKSRGGLAVDAGHGLPADKQAALEASWRASPVVSAEPFAQVPVTGSGAGARVLQAAQFREGILFVVVPADQVREPASDRRATRATQVPAPALLPVAVLVSTLQDAHALWLRLPAGEYFELVNEIWSTLDGLFTELGGRHGSHPGEGMVCHFLPHAGSGYLANALLAAHRTRDAMRQLSARWQSRKGWDVELSMNTGIDAGQDWIGPLRLVEPLELSVLGAAADHAGALSRMARGGSIWMTRGLVDRLDAGQRQRLQYGVPRRGADAATQRVLASFARLQDLAPTAAVPPAMADLPVTELIDLALPGLTPPHGQAPA